MTDNQQVPKESPWLSPPIEAQCVERTARTHVPSPRPNGEPPLVLVDPDELRLTVIRMVARRAAAILKEMESGKQSAKA